MKIRKMGVVALLALAIPAMAPAASPTDKAARSSEAAPLSDDVEKFDKRAADVRENLGKMQKQMDELQKTSDPAERQKLLLEHRELMQNTMGMMRQMWTGGMTSCCAQEDGGHPHRGGPMMGWHAMRGNYSDLNPEQQRERQYMRDQYMGMQQRMMEQMLQQQVNKAAPQE